jgi:hypothetical protein
MNLGSFRSVSQLRKGSDPEVEVTHHNAPEARGIVSSMSVTDTSPKVAAIHLELYRAAGPARRAQIAADLSDAVRETTLAGIRRRHPELSENDIRESFLQLVYGFGKRR